MLLGTQTVNGNGVLEIGGCDAVALAQEFGTPLYVVDEQCLRENCRAYREAFATRYPHSHISFSGKVLTTMAVFKIAHQEGLGLDVSSEGELHTALRAGIPARDIVFHGNNKSRREIERAVIEGVGRVGVDSLDEIEALQEVAAAHDATVDVLVRVAPGVAADTHTHIQTGRVDTKFGFPIVGGAAKEAVAAAHAAPNLKVRGINCHIGSQIMDITPFVQAVRLMVEFAAELRNSLDLVIEELDLGGGLGVRYLPEDRPPSIVEYAQAIADAMRASCEKYDLPLPRLIQEPGRRLAGEAGITLYTVGVVKTVPGIRTYVVVDGGLSDNPRPALYDARYHAIVANKARAPRTTTVTVAGKHCETDTLIQDLQAPEIAPGDILAVQTTGAYNYSMASNYNRLTRPAMVLVANGRADLIVERESLEDLTRLDRLPPRLRD